MIPPVTLLIVARNAATTIERALRSAVREPIAEIVLVDDWSDDDTARRARSVGGWGLRTIRPPEHRTVGFARQVAIEAVTTPLGVWIDADDEWLPSRLLRLLDALGDGRADFAFDAAEVVDTAKGAPLVHAPIPAFMRVPGGAVRLFERSYVPTLGVCAFRTNAMQRLGYDVTMHGGEDFDLALRAVADGHRFAFVDAPGYRIHTSPGSLSRRSANQRAMCRAALAKHTEADVLGLYAHAGYSPRVARWALVSMATFREEYQRALDLVEEAAALCAADDEILEPEGPEPWPEGWRVAFARGTLSLLLHRIGDALPALTCAEHLRPTAEGANNLAVALKRAGRHSAAAPHLAAALERRSDYADAWANLACHDAVQVTTHPLRQHATRTDHEVKGMPDAETRDQAATTRFRPASLAL